MRQRLRNHGRAASLPPSTRRGDAQATALGYAAKAIVSDWLQAFAFTQLVECPIYFLALRAHIEERGPRLAVAFGASALTHPIVWFVIPPLVYKTFPTLHQQPLLGTTAAWVVMALVAETFAVVAEASYLRQFKLEHPWRWSLGANGASVVLGLLSRFLFGAP